jgi:two-component system, OmpR family, sensor histidine kinase PhoQ
MKSLRNRLLLAASLVLAAFVFLCGFSLEQAFEDSALKAEQDELRGITYALLGSAEPQPDGEFDIAAIDLPDSRLQHPQSGLEAAVLNENGAIVWSSPSAGTALPDLKPAEVGAWRFHRLTDPDRFLLVFGLRWLDASEKPLRYTILVIEDAQAFREQIAAYRRTLWAWLGGISATLLIAQFLVLRWGLAPLRRLVGELRGIESGRQTAVQAQYPDELTPLTGALNAMIVAERNQQTRYRNALGDLAHSLKTPLAVLRGLESERMHQPEALRSLHEQVDRMQHIVDYQLRRAAAAGSRTLSEPIALAPVADKIRSALTKVYAAKQLAFEIRVPANLRLRADEGDLYELLGNLLDNACKWARSKVSLHAEETARRLTIIVDDDGNGFPEDVDSLAQRGVRADDKVPGQGIGLASVAELIKAYNGEMQLLGSPFGGARVQIRLPT